MANDTLSDSDLVRLAHEEGSHEAWAIIFDRYNTPVYNLARKLLHDPDDAYDVTAEAFLKTWRNIPTLATSKPLNLPAYLCLAARHLCVDRMRRQANLRFVPWDYTHDDLSAVADGDPALVAEALEARRTVWSVLDAMSYKHRTALTLREFRGLSCAEIGSAMGGLTRMAVKSLLFRARIEFRAKYTAMVMSKEAAA